MSFLHRSRLRSSSGPARGRRAGHLFLAQLLLAGGLVVGDDVSAAEVGDDTFDGTVTGLVFNDYNGNGQLDTEQGIGVAVDRGIGGIQVDAYDSAGINVASTVSAADGTYTLNVTGSASEAIRIEFAIPDGAPFTGFVPSAAYWQGAAQTDPATPRSGGSIRFVDLGATRIDFAVMRPGDYCDDATLVTCILPIGDEAGTNFSVPGLTEFSARSDGMLPTFVPNPQNYSGRGFQVRSFDLGSVFGIGIDRSGRSVDGIRVAAPNAFIGTYVKRHSEYGFNGNTNTIYRVPLLADGGSEASVFVTLPGTLPLHDASAGIGEVTGIRYADDRAIFTRVGRIGLGDVDVTDDGTTLLAVDMDETAPKLYFVPILGTGDDVTAGTVTSAAIPAPGTFGGVACPGTWHPMGIGTRGERILVGGVCGAEDTTSTASPRGPAPTQAAAFVLEYTGARDGSGTFATIFAMRMDYNRGCGTTVHCDNAGSTAGSINSADWVAWNEYPLYRRNPVGDRWLATNPQPMLSNVEITDSGDLVLAFRDRWTDQQSSGMMAWTEAFNDDEPDVPTGLVIGGRARVFAAGEILRVCNASGTLTLEADGTCAGGLLGSEAPDFTSSGRLEYYWDNFPHFGSSRVGTQHTETANGSTATLPGWTGVWSTAYDINFVDQQGVLTFGACADMQDPSRCLPDTDLAAGFPNDGYGNRLGGINFPRSGSGIAWPNVGATFEKGNGLADLELVCDQAPVQIGNRIWLDLDGDGLQGPDEPGIAGVTVRLYDASGTLVGTAITGPDGSYFFSSASGEAPDGGTEPDAFGGGLLAGATFTVRLDEPRDYAEGGPLHEYALTTTRSTAEVVTRIAGGLDSDASLVGRFPVMAVSALGPGTYDHRYDAGFVFDPDNAIGAAGVFVDDDPDVQLASPVPGNIPAGGGPMPHELLLLLAAGMREGGAALLGAVLLLTLLGAPQRRDRRHRSTATAIAAQRMGPYHDMPPLFAGRVPRSGRSDAGRAR
jgi:hypothetical protein